MVPLGDAAGGPFDFPNIFFWFQHDNYKENIVAFWINQDLYSS